jgi:glycosyltransferase involved in cell wall biosynthesis
MAAVVNGLMKSPLAQAYRFDFVPTWRSRRPLNRVLTLARALVDLARWCLRPGRRIVHIHAAMRGSLYRKATIVLVAKLLRRPVVLHIHAGPGDIVAFCERLRKTQRALFKRAFSSADRVLSVSRASAEEIGRYFGPVEVLVIPNPAPRVPASQPLRRDHDGRVGLLYLGGFENPTKGGTTLVEALPEIIAACPNARVEVAGPGFPPPALETLAARTTLVKWTGWLDEQAKASALAACDIFLLPSSSEGLPMALLEAMAYGKATVATCVGGIPELATDGVEAMLVEPGNPSHLASVVAELVDDEATRERVGRTARQRVKRLNQTEVFGALDRVYRELAGRHD